MWKLVRIWILSSWSFLTIGILLGSWWAYHELGWGGWWFWDPVENASLMPWLLATACIHSITKPKLNYWTLISTQATFILSILGTFFVRSGLLSSVHSFATDSTRAQALLFFLLSITSISVFNWISLCFKLVPVPGQAPVPGRKRASFFYSVLKPVPGQSEMKRSLEQILFLQNFYLSVICIVVFCGTSAPLLFHWLWNRNVGTGAPFYNATVVPLFTSVFFVLVYAHYIQFNMSKARLGLGYEDALLAVKRVYYCIFFFFLHVLILRSEPLIGLNFLDSIYGAICILLMSSIIAPAASNKISKRAAYRPCEARLRPVLAHPTESTRLPCRRHIVLTPKLQFGIQWPRNQQKFKSDPHGSSNIIANAPSLDIAATTGNRFIGVRKELYGGPTVGAARSTPLKVLPKRGGPHPKRTIWCDLRQKRKAPLDGLLGTLDAKAPLGWTSGGGGKMGGPPPAAAFLGREAPVQMNVAHTGIVLFILGILLSNTFKLELTEQLHSGPLGIRLGSQVCCLRSIDHSFAPTYHSICANLLVYQQVNIDGLYRLRLAPFAHNLNLQMGHLRRHDAGARVSSLLSLSKVDITLRSGPSSSNGYSDPLRGPLVRLEGPFMGSVCMFPEKRFYYSNQGAIATKVAIHSNLFTDFYSLIGTGSFETGWFTTIMKLPFIFCIWLGFMFGVFGGALAVKKQLQKSKLFWL